MALRDCCFIYSPLPTTHPFTEPFLSPFLKGERNGEKSESPFVGRRIKVRQIEFLAKFPLDDVNYKIALLDHCKFLIR